LGTDPHGKLPTVNSGTVADGLVFGWLAQKVPLLHASKELAWSLSASGTWNVPTRESQYLQPFAQDVDPNRPFWQYARLQMTVLAGRAAACAAKRGLLLAGECAGPPGLGMRTRSTAMRRPAKLVHQRDGRHRLVDRRRTGPGGEHVPPPGGDGSLGADHVGERVALGAGVRGQPTGVRGGLPLVCPDGAG
jgi:hypothetical protein